MINNISLLYFSPTKTTKKILEAIAIGMAVKTPIHVDLTSVSNDFVEVKSDITIIGVPVYSGRVSPTAVERLKKIKGSGPAIIVVVYGNREYEDAMLELKNISLEQGFNPIASAAFIGEHSFSTEQLPIAKSRPDEKDLDKAKTFGAEIQKLIKEAGFLNQSVSVPGDYPYKVLVPRPEVAPITIESKCDRCGICISVCPTDAIQMNGLPDTDSHKCILCCACVKYCPTNARLNDNDLVKNISEKLANICSFRREPKFYGLS